MSDESPQEQQPGIKQSKLREQVLTLIRSFHRPPLSFQDAVGCAVAVLVEDHFPNGQTSGESFAGTYRRVVLALFVVAMDQMILAGFPTKGYVALAAQESRTWGDVLRVAGQMCMQWSLNAFAVKEHPTPRDNELQRIARELLTPSLTPAQGRAALEEAAILLSKKVAKETGRPAYIQRDDVKNAVFEQLEWGKPIGFLSKTSKGRWRVLAKPIASVVRSRSQYSSAGSVSLDQKIRATSSDEELRMIDTVKVKPAADHIELMRMVREHVDFGRIHADGIDQADFDAAFDHLFSGYTQDEASEMHSTTRKRLRRALAWLMNRLREGLSA